ncbi:alpha/beta hydrolase-fold protein [Rhizobium sp. 2MFCol3.1]|uniref:esterase family protein n=1 Tax=Rhizobium sp. 2MFCol3.1 TaxID=1246459 RepID=UPI00036582EC|nr:alpha/beta hydrolase-fold protein [Rhizobium sp. 2MFCol3.1]
MNREYLRWHSPRLHREMELLVFGHAGAKVLMFPTRDGRFWEYERIGLVASLAHKLEAGQLQLYCIEGLATETFYGFDRHPADRIHRHQAFEDYILHEVLPLMASRNGHDCTIVHGCSLGAFQAASLVFRHPHLFRKLVAFSGRYDLTLRVLPGLHHGWQLDKLREVEIVMTIGNADPFLDNNHYLSRLLSDKQVGHQLHVWDGRAHRASAWRKMAALYI